MADGAWREFVRVAVEACGSCRAVRACDSGQLSSEVLGLQMQSRQSGFGGSLLQRLFDVTRCCC